MTISGPGWPPGHICPSRPSPPATQNLRIDTLSRKYHFSIQTLLNNDHLGAWLASGPYLPSPAFPLAPQNLGIDIPSRKYHFSIQTLLNNNHFGAWLAAGPCEGCRLRPHFPPHPISCTHGPIPVPILCGSAFYGPVIFCCPCTDLYRRFASSWRSIRDLRLCR